MAKRKSNGELVINQSPGSCVEVEFKIDELLQKLSDNENNTKRIDSPKFNLGGVEMFIRVYPDYKSSGFISVFLDNFSNQDQVCSATFKTPAGAEKGLKRAIVKAKVAGRGFPKFLSHAHYKKWAEENGDVFKVVVSVFIHTKETVTFSSFGQTIMEDDSTADFIIRCKSKTFHVHKTFFCARLGLLYLVSDCIFNH